MRIYNNRSMDSDTLKGQLINNYLSQQLSVAGGDEDSGESSREVRSIELPDNAILEEFKNQVRLWMEIDSQVAKLQGAIKERKQVKKKLTEKILAFMGKFNIEDLNTKDGKLRYRVNSVKPTVTKAEIKRRLVENYGKVDNLEKLTELIFSSNEDSLQPKPSLRRMKTRS